MPHLVETTSQFLDDSFARWQIIRTSHDVASSQQCRGLYLAGHIPRCPNIGIRVDSLNRSG
jgi:hypothetical protein